MRPLEMGLVYNQLRDRRVLFGFKLPGRNRTQEEQDAVRLIEQHPGSRADLDEFLLTQGMRLVAYEAAAFDLPAAGRVYVAVRDASEVAPAHLGLGTLLREVVDARRSETVKESAVWAASMLMVLMQLQYTENGRTIEAVSRYQDAVVDETQFVDAVLRLVERVTAAPPAAPDAGRLVRDVLAGSTQSQTEARARSFLRALVRLGVLEESSARVRIEGKEEVLYAQTLWSAVDIALNFKRFAGTLVAPVDERALTAFVVEGQAVTTPRDFQEE